MHAPNPKGTIPHARETRNVAERRDIDFGDRANAALANIARLERTLAAWRARVGSPAELDDIEAKIARIVPVLNECAPLDLGPLDEPATDDRVRDAARTTYKNLPSAAQRDWRRAVMEQVDKRTTAFGRCCSWTRAEMQPRDVVADAMACARRSIGAQQVEGARRGPSYRARRTRRARHAPERVDRKKAKEVEPPSLSRGDFESPPATCGCCCVRSRR